MDLGDHPHSLGLSYYVRTLVPSFLHVAKFSRCMTHSVVHLFHFGRAGQGTQRVDMVILMYYSRSIIIWI